MTNRRASGEGSLYQRSDGRWVGAISLGIDANGKRKRKYVTASKKTLAAKKLAELKASLTITDVDDHDYTVQEWCDEWLKKISPETAAPHTVDGYRRNLVQYVYPSLGHIELGRLTAKHVMDFQYQLKISNLKPSSVKVARRPLCAALNAAVRMGLRDSNPVTAVRLPKETRVGPVGKRLNKEEVDTLIAAAHKASPHVELFVLLGVTRGLRRGEICGLWWDDVDLDNHVAHVTRNLIQSSAAGIDGIRTMELCCKEPKSFTSRRSFTIDTRLEGAFRRVKAQQNRDRLKSPEQWPKERYVFTARNGRPRWPGNVARSYRDFLKANNLPRTGVHDLRRTFANTASQADASIDQISEALGHASTAITKSLYIGQVPVLATRAFDAVDDYLNPTHSTPRIAGQP